MECFCIRNIDYESQDFKRCYEIFYNNMKKIANNGFYDLFVVDIEKWKMDLMRKNPTFLIYKNGEEIVGYIIVLEKEDDNFIYEYQIESKYQGDGSTFNRMIFEGIKNIDINKGFSGKIWAVNDKSKKVFEHLGAKFDDNSCYYHLDAETLKEKMKNINK